MARLTPRRPPEAILRDEEEHPRSSQRHRLQVTAPGELDQAGVELHPDLVLGVVGEQALEEGHRELSEIIPFELAESDHRSGSQVQVEIGIARPPLCHLADPALDSKTIVAGQIGKGEPHLGPSLQRPGGPERRRALLEEAAESFDAAAGVSAHGRRV